MCYFQRQKYNFFDFVLCTFSEMEDAKNQMRRLIQDSFCIRKDIAELETAPTLSTKQVHDCNQAITQSIRRFSETLEVLQSHP